MLSYLSMLPNVSPYEALSMQPSSSHPHYWKLSTCSTLLKNQANWAPKHKGLASHPSNTSASHNSLGQWHSTFWPCRPDEWHAAGHGLDLVCQDWALGPYAAPIQPHRPGSGPRALCSPLLASSLRIGPRGFAPPSSIPTCQDHAVGPCAAPTQPHVPGLGSEALHCLCPVPCVRPGSGGLY